MKQPLSSWLGSLVALVAISGNGAEVKLLPGAAPAGAAFGSAVAVHGHLAVVGAPRELDASGTRQAGAAYVTTTDVAASWRLTPTDAGVRHLFGRAVAVDGSRIVVGAAYAAYVFRYDGADWVEEAKLEQNCSQGRFGTAVAISGNRLVVGSPLLGCLEASTQGYVFFYQRLLDGSWAQESRRTSDYGTVGSHYGASVSMDGNTAVVGAPGWGEVFTYRHDGANWQTGPRITDPVWGSARGFARSISLQGGRLVVGAPGDSEMREGAGAAYVYRQTEIGGWAGEGKLLPPPTSPVQKLTGSYYGSSVGISGELLVLGGPQADATQVQDGAVLVFALQSGVWTHRLSWTATGAGSYDFLGGAVAIDHGTVLAGAPGHDAAGSDVGAAYLITVSGNQPPPPDDPPDDPPPANQSPTASFTFTTDGLTAHFDGSGSTDPEGPIANYSWDLGDAVKANGLTVSHTYAYSGTFTVRLTVSDSQGALGTTTQPVTVRGDSDLVLGAAGYKLRGLQKARLDWLGTAAERVDVYRNAVWIATTANRGSYLDNIDARGRGTYTYRICEEGKGKCSNEAAVVFD